MCTSTPKVIDPDVGNHSSKIWNFRKPQRADGDSIYNLIADCPPLDMNSSYCNFLQSTHFSKTSILVEQRGKIAGFISGYLKPDQQNTLFIWQVAVSARFRGYGLAFRMLTELLTRKELGDVKTVETTITEDNKASWALFKKLDEMNSNAGQISTFLNEKTHFKGKHDTEYLYRIPLKQ